MKSHDKMGAGELYVEVFDGREIPMENDVPTKKAYDDAYLGATNVDKGGKGSKWTPVTLSRAPKDKVITLLTFDEDKVSVKDQGKTRGAPIAKDSSFKKFLLGQTTVTYADLKGAGKTIDMNPKDPKKGKITISIDEPKKEESKDKGKDAKSSSKSGKDDKDGKDNKDSKAGSSSSKSKSEDSSNSDKISIEYLQKLARYQVDQAQKKVDDAKNEQRAAQELLDRLVRLQPKRSPSDMRTEASSRYTSDERAYSPPRSRYDERRRYDDYLSDDDYPPLSSRYGPPPPRYDPYARPGFVDARPLRPVGYGFAPAPPIVSAAPILAPPPFSTRYY